MIAVVGKSLLMWLVLLAAMTGNGGVLLAPWLWGRLLARETRSLH